MKIAREALPFGAVLAVLALAAGWGLHPLAAAPLLLALLFTLWFFRDPERTPPGDPQALISPADGRVIRSDAQRVSVFMNVFNVHVCRAPVAGRVSSVSHVPGRFLAAFKEHASEQNERTSIVLGDGEGRVRFTLVAGLVARRIVCKVVEGQQLDAGERVGLIRFGSRVDVDLPSGAHPAVRVGDRVLAGETVLARLGSTNVSDVASPPAAAD